MGERSADPSAGNIFISYRRGADSNAAGRLYDRLERHFAAEQIFFDIDAIPLGVNFAEFIDQQVAKCDVMLVVIGPSWIEAMPRLESAGDFVRIEIEAALKRAHIPVIPVLFDGADMPKPDALPDTIRPLVMRNAITVTTDHFAQIVDGRLTDALRSVLGVTEDTRKGAQQGSQTSTFSKKLPAAFGWMVVAVVITLAAFEFMGGDLQGILRNAQNTPEAIASEPEQETQDRPAVPADLIADLPETSDDLPFVTQSGPTKRDADLEHLHPALRGRIAALLADLKAEDIPFALFEGYRSPEQQAELFAKGRTSPGTKVTWVGPWRSAHQFGLAANLALMIDGKWSWDDQGPEAEYWDRMIEMARELGLTPIYNSKGQLIEKGHLTLLGLSLSQIRDNGFDEGADLPEDGDRQWALNIFGALNSAPEGLTAQQVATLKSDLWRILVDGAGTDPTFQKLHEFIRRWEGGFVNHPQANGGPVNMGVTQSLLANWRGKSVTVEDVRNLSRTEADAIFKARVYDSCHCGEMPERVAAVVYNAAVMHGCKRAITFVQTAFNELGMTADGKPLDTDGLLGPLDMAAIKRTDPTVLAEETIKLQEQYLRNHEDFDVFGRGWLNRLAGLRDFVQTLSP